MSIVKRLLLTELQDLNGTVDSENVTLGLYVVSDATV